MAAFAGPRPGTTRLVRNHELRHGSAIDGDAAGVVVPDALKWDPNAIGGTTTLLVDGDGGVLDDRASLGGTENNCAGGPTPWGSWLTCEETVATPESTGGRLARRHGYVFEVPAHGMTPTAARPIVGMGRFVHEAAAVDPRSGTVYLSEDRPDGALYRYRPREPGRLIAGGALEALRLRDGGGRSVDTSRGLRGQLGRRLAVDWVPVAEPDSADDSARRQAQSLGAARFARGEGLWAAGPGGASDARITLVCTSGGDAGLGQVFAYDPADDSLTLVTESTDRDVLEHPDNVAPGPDGRLLLCEDGPGGNALVGLDEDGTPFTFARNLFNDSEFCGACSSPDGRFLFVNVQEPGLTLVIEGPWRRPPPR
jgi:secreted PhoX family phosphatase